MLIEQLADGDRALGELYERYGGVTFSLARAITGSDPDAAEVVLDTFLEVWRNAPDYDAARGSVRTWLATITRSRALDLVRSRKRRANAVEESAASDALGFAVALGKQSDVEAELDRSLARTQVTEWLGDLPSKQREALELAYLEGYSHSEIASKLDTPLGTVKTRIRTALAELRDKVQPQTGEVGT